MIKTTRQYFCDVCGKDMTEDRYFAGISILQFDNDGEVETIGLSFWIIPTVISAAVAAWLWETV